MNRRAILAIARKDAVDVLINKSTLVMLITPLVLAILFAVMGNLLGDKTSKILVYDPGNSQVVSVLKSAFQNPQVVSADSANAVSSAFGPDGAQKKSEYSAGLVVPKNFDQSLQAGQHPQLALYINGDQVDNQTSALLERSIADYSRSVADPEPPAQLSTSTINPPDSTVAADVSKFYALAALLASFMVGTSLVPGMMIEEKEKKTLRMLMVSPASWTDIVVGKVLVGLCYQLILSGVVLAITQGFIGQVPIVILFTILGSCFSVALGVLLGCLFRTSSSAGAFAGFVSFLYIVPTFFVGSLGELFHAGVIDQAIRVLPTYYLADGAANALENQMTTGVFALDAGIAVGSIVVLFAAAVWALRRQASVASLI